MLRKSQRDRKHAVVCFGGNAEGKEAKVATRALIQTKVELSDASMRFEEIYSGPLPACPECEALASAHPKAKPVYVSGAAALRGAKGALMALGTEAAAALCLLGLWWLWHN
jgi:hypothetical protein